MYFVDSFVYLSPNTTPLRWIEQIHWENAVGARNREGYRFLRFYTFYVSILFILQWAIFWHLENRIDVRCLIPVKSKT
jgi:hypothetical protein